MSRDIHAPIEHKEEDLLGRHLLAERIYSRLCREDCPQAIGVYGGWGTGKTSLLKLLLEIHDKVKAPLLQIEYIDAWQYENSGDLFVPAIVRLMARKTAVNQDISTYLKRVSLAALYMGSDIALRSLTGLDFGDVERYMGEVKHNEGKHITSLTWEDLTDTVEETNRAMKALVDKVNQGIQLAKIAFLIDNLDRCSPENTVRLLESIKNFLSVPGCVWVFAMDSGVVASYIDRKYEGTTMDGNSYLDKIIPEQYHLSFFPEESDSRIYDLVRSAAGRELTLNDWKRLPLIPSVMVPRRLKKSTVKFAEYFDGQRTGGDRDTVFLLCLLYHSWPDFYERLSSSSSQHIGRILANFFQKKNFQDESVRWGEYMPLPLDKKFAENQDLIYFLQTAFPNNSSGEEVVGEIHQAMAGLRQIGLP
ncbi:MAG: KAP family P-loop NTPase fold protein [Chloroflexota bacterium]